MKSSNGNAIANQLIITEQTKAGRIEYFQSYRSIIAKKDYRRSPAKVTLDSQYWDYSQTTGKYRNIFLGEGIAETRKKIDSGEYKLADLN